MIMVALWGRLLERSTPFCTGERELSLENFENQGALKFTPVQFIAPITDFVEGHWMRIHLLVLNNFVKLVVLKIFAPDVLSNKSKSNEEMCQYLLFILYTLIAMKFTK